jgi:hypothetical protein
MRILENCENITRDERKTCTEKEICNRACYTTVSHTWTFVLVWNLKQPHGNCMDESRMRDARRVSYSFPFQPD